MHDPHDTEDGNPFAPPREVGEEPKEQLPRGLFIVPIILSLFPAAMFAASICLTWRDPFYFSVFYGGLFATGLCGMLLRQKWALWFMLLVWMSFFCFFAYKIALDLLNHGRYLSSEPGLELFIFAYVVCGIVSTAGGLYFCNKRRRNHADA